MHRFFLLLLPFLLVACRQANPGALARLHPCQIEEGPPDAYCGQHTVFENRATRQGRTIDLKIVVAPALRRDAKPDPLFVFEGGPGGGAATLARFRIPMFRRFQTDRDIVLIDQRGTGHSNPLDCDEDRSDEDLADIDTYPIDRFRRCLERIHADARLYTTPIAMDDVDEVRQFLGYDAINLWGGSYGTRAALVYLKRHEASVRTVTLDGVAPPDMRLPLYMARDGQRALDRLIDACAADANCAKQFPDLRSAVDVLWAKLESRPEVPFVHPRTGKQSTIHVSRRLIASIVFQSLYSPEVATLLPRLLTDAAGGNYQGVLALAFSQDLPKGAMSEGMFLSVVCAEDAPRIAPDEIARESTGRFIGGAMFETRVKPCEFWPRGDVSADYYQPIASAKPVLVFSGADDPVTPPSWGEDVVRHLSNAKHVVVPGAGHITIGRGCVPELLETFLAKADPNAVDPACLSRQQRPPFFTDYIGPGRP